MKMQPQEKVIKCYNDTADNYAAERIDELSKKHLDRLLLKEFASVNKDKGLCVDFGCGPGQTTKFLYDHGVKDLIGIDISSGMIDAARRHFPKIKFENGDLLNVPYASNYLGNALAFYAIVHFTYDQVKFAFSEVNRVLKKGGQFLFSFHAGNETVHFDKAGDIGVDVDLFFFQKEQIIELLHETGFRIIDALMNHSIDIRQYFTPIQPNASTITGNLVYQELSPDIRLQKYIYCYWQFKTTQPLAEGLNHIIVADGCIDIFFELHNPQDNFVMGFCEKFTEFSLNPTFNYVGVRFLPTMFSQIFKINAKEITNKFEHLANVVPSTSFFIREHIEPENNLAEIKSIFDNYFLQLIDESNFDWDSRIYESLKIILKNYGVVEIQKDLNTGISQRQLRRLFEFYIGDTPKAFSQVVRFQNILKAKPSNQSLKQNKLFFDLGYYDQSHFIKEFKKLHGVTPNKAFGM